VWHEPSGPVNANKVLTPVLAMYIMMAYYSSSDDLEISLLFLSFIASLRKTPNNKLILQLFRIDRNGQYRGF
jgi:hypothetical protein